MTPDPIDELITRARQYAVEPGGDDPLPDIDAAMAATDDPYDLARLHGSRASARQATDIPLAIDDMLTASELFTRADRLADAAACTAAAATLVQLTGDWGRALELAVAATIQLADVSLDDLQGARAASALCAFYGHMGAFELAAPFGRRCLAIAERFPDLPRLSLVFNAGVIFLEGAHLTSDDERDAMLRDVDVAAELMQASDQPSSATLGSSLAASAALVRGQADVAKALAATIAAAEPVAVVFQAWLAVLAAEVAHLDGSHADAERLLDMALPALEAASEHNTLLRGLALRSDVRRSAGDPDGALADANRRAELARRWQVERTAHYAALIASQAELERDGSLLRRQAGELARAVIEDPLTGLYSRRWLTRRLVELEGLDREGAVLMIDIDHFKAVNDTHGHGVGDRVLAAVASVLSGSMRDGDVVRYGGEEFLVAITADAATALAIAERARLALTHASFDDIVPDLRLTISVGIAHGPLRRVRELVDAADEALYVAKHSGRNRVVTAEPLREGRHDGNA